MMSLSLKSEPAMPAAGCYVGLVSFTCLPAAARTTKNLWACLVMHAQYVAVASAVAVVRGRSVLDKMERPECKAGGAGDTAGETSDGAHLARSSSIPTGPGRYCAAASV